MRQGGWFGSQPVRIRTYFVYVTIHNGHHPVKKCKDYDCEQGFVFQSEKYLQPTK